jgi:hypothetical protein
VFADEHASMADAPLTISDDRAERTTNPALRRAYRQVRDRPVVTWSRRDRPLQASSRHMRRARDAQ